MSEPNVPALEFISPTAAVIARKPAPLARGIVWIVAAMFASIVALMALMPTDRVVSATARVISTTPNILVQPLEASIVRSFDVRPNQVVRRGELIARLDPTFAGADLASLRAQENSLAAEVARLEAEASGQDYNGGATPAEALQAAIFAQRKAERSFRIESFQQRMRSFQESIARGQAELTQLQQRARIAGQIEDMRRELERVQIGSRLNSLIATDSRLEVQRGMANTEGSMRSAARDLAVVSAEMDGYIGQYRSELAQQLAERRRTLSDVMENLTKAQLRRDLVEFRAPVDAVVLELGKTSVGAVLAPGEQLVSLVPLDTTLLIDAEVLPRDLGFVGVGDRVALKFETFPYVRHGTARGTVTSISEDTTRRPEGQPNAPSTYRTRISIDEMNLRNLPAEFRLLPGMPVQADIIVGRRTPLRYFFERAVPGLTEGMREP